MVMIQDRIDVSADKLTSLQTLFREHYLPAAQQRGMRLLESRVSPPLLLANGKATLWQRWEVADIGAWWAMRGQAGVAGIASFWQTVDGLCDFRERVYLSGEGDSLDSGQDIDTHQVTTRGYRETAQLELKDNLSDEDKAALVDSLNKAQNLAGLEAFSLSENMAPEYAAGHYTFDLLFKDSQAALAARETNVWREQIAPALARYCASCHAVTLDTIGAGLRASTLTNAIKRTAFFRVLPEVDSSVAHRFEQDLLEMPAQIPQILNWRLSRAIALDWNTNEEAWTYVWEQEFESLDDLLGPYMTHPHHWAHIDRWFDPESGVQAIDVNLSHAFSALNESLMAREAQG